MLAALRERRTTAEALVEAALGTNLARADLNAMAAVDAEAALSAARRCDRDLAAGRPMGALHGVPMTVKDLFEVEGLPTRAGTQAPLSPLGGEGAAVARLRAAGAIILGKANMHEAALGLTGENPWTGDVKNPHHPERQAGGSSSGSGAAVAVGIGSASLGTDTGGSIRVPAALCGVVGFKPTHGRVPLDGALPLSPSCDHAGPLALTVADARRMTEVLAERPLPAGDADGPLRLGLPRRYLDGRLAPAMRDAFEALLLRLRARGCGVAEVEVEDLDLTLAAYTPLVRAEAAHVHREALERGGEGFSPPVRAALQAGARLSAGEYLAARENRRRVCAGLEAAFREGGIAALILPATPAPAPRRGVDTVELESGSAPAREAQLALTAPFSLAGVPALSLPFGRADGLPLGLQLVTPRGEDARALTMGERLEGMLAGPGP